MPVVFHHKIRRAQNDEAKATWWGHRESEKEDIIDELSANAGVVGPGGR